MTRIGQTEETTQVNQARNGGNGNNTNQTNVNLNIQMVNPEAVGKNEDGFKKSDSGKTSTKPTSKKKPAPAKPNPPAPSNSTVINSNSGNYIGSAAGDVIIGNGNAKGGDNSTNVPGNGNLVNPQPKEADNGGNSIPDPTPPEPTPQPKAKLRENNGQSLAKDLHDETDSHWADNGKVAKTFHKVNSQNAYSFFKEYSNLARRDYNEKTEDTIQDTFNISDTFNRISLLDTTPAMEALAEQAEKLDSEFGTELCKTQAYRNLQQQIHHAKMEISKYSLIKPGGADANEEEAKQFDLAIKDMVEEMTKVFE